MNKNNFTHQFFKTRIFACMIYGQFLPKSSSNLSFVFQDSRIWGLRGDKYKDLEPFSNLSYF